MLLIESPIYALKKATGAARLKECLSNIRVLTGAIEMYNMDNATMLDTALPGGDYEEVEKLLIKGRYLKSNIGYTDEGCSYGFINILATGSVFCKKHGTVEKSVEGEFDKPELPEYDTSLEKPFSKEYEEIRYSILRDAQSKRNRGKFFFYLSQEPYLLLIIFVVIFVVGGYIGNLMYKKLD